MISCATDKTRRYNYEAMNFTTSVFSLSLSTCIESLTSKYSPVVLRHQNTHTHTPHREVCVRLYVTQIIYVCLQLFFIKLIVVKS